MFGWKFEVGRWNMMLSSPEDQYSMGIGWWVRGHWKELSGWLMFRTLQYDGGRWWSVRLGPFFLCRCNY
jgi:hypothetical protein